jgi:hypothetical protein
MLIFPEDIGKNFPYPNFPALGMVQLLLTEVRVLLPQIVFISCRNSVLW